MNNYVVYKLRHYIRKGFFKITFKNFKIGGASKI